MPEESTEVMITMDPAYRKSQSYTRIRNLLLYSDLPNPHFRVYTALVGYIWNKQDTTGQCAFPGQKKIAKRLNMKQPYISKILKELDQTYNLLRIDYLSQTPRRCVYTILPPPVKFFREYTDFDGTQPYKDMTEEMWRKQFAWDADEQTVIPTGITNYSYRNIETALSEQGNPGQVSGNEGSDLGGNKQRLNKQTTDTNVSTQSVEDDSENPDLRGKNINSTPKNTGQEKEKTDKTLDLLNDYYEKYSKEKPNWNETCGALKTLLESLGVFLSYPEVGKLRKGYGDRLIYQCIHKLRVALKRNNVGNAKAYFYGILNKERKNGNKDGDNVVPENYPEDPAEWSEDQFELIKDRIENHPKLHDHFVRYWRAVALRAHPSLGNLEPWDIVQETLVNGYG